MDPITKFNEQIRLALYGVDTKEIKLGNVTFWIEDNAAVCYNLPTSKWDKGSISPDLTIAVIAGAERAKRAIAKD